MLVLLSLGILSVLGEQEFTMELSGLDVSLNILHILSTEAHALSEPRDLPFTTTFRGFGFST
jgi:hypothetical protein